MIYGINKFKMGTRDWPYVVEFYRTNDQTQEGELLTLRTRNRPRPALIENAHKVAELALAFAGMSVILDANQNRELGFGLSTVTWSDGESAGTKVEINVIGKRPIRDRSESSEMKLVLEKVDRREEFVDVDIGGGLKERRPDTNSVKNAYLEKVKLLQEQVQGFVEGQVEQGELFDQAERA